MKKERLRILDLLEQGKITADEASKLLEALKSPTVDFDDMESDFATDVEEKLNRFSRTMDSFAKDFGDKMSGTFKDVEPKVKNVTKHVISKTAAIMDEISKSLNESLKSMEGKDCCCDEEKEECCCGNDDEPREN